MANWCSNYVEFTSVNQEKLNELYSILEDLQTRQETNEIFFDVDNDDFIHDLFLFDQTEFCVTITYITSWSPNIVDLKKLATKFECNFNIEYKETGHEIFGKSSFENGELIVQDLSNDDFEKYSFDDDNSLYIFEGEEYECEDDILETLWKRKYNFI